MGGAWRDRSHAAPPAPAFLSLDEKDGRFCAKEGDDCKCFGRVRFGRLVTWSNDVLCDGNLNCSAEVFGDPLPFVQNAKVCKCYPTICTTDTGICTPEPCECPKAGHYEWSKKTMTTSDGNKCWACERMSIGKGEAVDGNSTFCPTEVGRCTLNRACRCENAEHTKRVMKTKDGKKCWNCAAPKAGGMGMDSGQKAMFWMLPMLWPFMNGWDSFWDVCNGCRVMTTILGLCVGGYLLQNKPFTRCINLNRIFSFYAPCMKRGELWRLFTYAMLHSDIQHLCTNLMHLLDALDLEGVPALEVSPGVPLSCTRDGPLTSICYPDIGIGGYHVICLVLCVLAYGALVGTIRNFTALVQGASAVCFGVDGALIAMYAMFLGAGLDSQLKIPQFGMFFWMRIGIIGFHIVIDVVQSLCGSKDTVGTMAHMSSLVCGFCYVLLFLPPMGDRSLFDSYRPYIIPCTEAHHSFFTMDHHEMDCLAFFTRSNYLEVDRAQMIAKVILGGGVLAAIANAIAWRHEPAGDYACCQPKGSSSGGGGGGPVAQNQDSGDPQRMEQIRGVMEAMRNRLVQLESHLASIPNPNAGPAATTPLAFDPMAEAAPATSSPNSG